MRNENILDVTRDYFIEYASDLIPNNLPSVCDGLLPVHRKMIYALNESGITHNKPFKKLLAAGTEVMKYYIFGDAPLHQAMKNAGSNFVLYKYLEPKGQFPDKNRRDGVGAAPRYIECRLSEYAEYLLDGIKYKNVPFKPNWDNSREEPVFLPCPVPNMLINNSESIAVGFASKIPSHNLYEVCDAFIDYLQNQDIESAAKKIKGIDSPLGGSLIYDENETMQILMTGQGSYQMMANYEFNEKTNTLTITEIPMSTVIEDIDDKIRQNIEKGNLREIVDVHDNSGKDGMRYDIYLKKNVNLETVISKLRKYTPFQSSVPVYLYMIKPDGITPHLYNLEDMIIDWSEHRKKCIIKEVSSQNELMKNRRTQMEGLLKIASDIDKAVEIIKNAKDEKQALEQLIQYFELTEYQAKYIATIRMVNMNKEWIGKQTKEYEELGKKISENEYLISEDSHVVKLIIWQLQQAKLKYGAERKTKILYDTKKNVTVDIVDDYNCNVLCTEQGYVKKMLRYSDNQKLKDGDSVAMVAQTTNKSNLLVFTNKANMYTLKVSSLEDVASSALGQYLPSLLEFESDEVVVYSCATADYKGSLLFCFENGKVARIDMEAYKKSLKKMTKAFNTESQLVNICLADNKQFIQLDSQNGKRLILSLENIRIQGSRNTKGVQVMKVKENDKIIYFQTLDNQNEDFVQQYLVGSAAVGKSIKQS